MLVRAHDDKVDPGGEVAAVAEQRCSASRRRKTLSPSPVSWTKAVPLHLTHMLRHARPCAGHPRLCRSEERRGWPGIWAFTPVFDGLCPAMTEYIQVERKPL